MGPRHASQPTKTSTAASAAPPPTDVATAKTSDAKKHPRLRSMVRIAFNVALLLLIFGVVIPGFAPYSEVWEAITSLTVGWILVLSAVTLALEFSKAVFKRIVVPKLGVWHAFLSGEASSAVSNTIPGPSGMAMGLSTYRLYGVDATDFGRSTMLYGIANNGLSLLMPAVAVILLVAQYGVGTVPSQLFWIGGFGILISLAGIALIALIVRSERFAYRFGSWVATVANWGLKLVRKPPVTQIPETVVHFRTKLLDAAREHWVALTAVMLGKYLLTFLVLLLSLRALGAGRVDLTAIEVLTVYAVVRLLTMVQLTPGGVGIAETLYITGLLLASGGTAEDAIVAAVFLFRTFTYVGLILLGAGSYLLLARQRARAARAET